VNQQAAEQPATSRVAAHTRAGGRSCCPHARPQPSHVVERERGSARVGDAGGPPAARAHGRSRRRPCRDPRGLTRPVHFFSANLQGLAAAVEKLGMDARASHRPGFAVHRGMIWLLRHEPRWLVELLVQLGFLPPGRVRHRAPADGGVAGRRGESRSRDPGRPRTEAMAGARTGESDARDDPSEPRDRAHPRFPRAAGSSQGTAGGRVRVGLSTAPRTTLAPRGPDLARRDCSLDAESARTPAATSERLRDHAGPDPP